MPIKDEPTILKLVSNYFNRKSTQFVLSKTPKNGNLGTNSKGKTYDEFGVVVDNNPRLVDVASFSWSRQGKPISIAVECKGGESSRAVADSLSQAIHYQIFFDEVYIATGGDAIGDTQKNLLDKLGIGYLNIPDSRHIIKVLEPRRKEKPYDYSLNQTQVTPRAAMFLAFRDVLGVPYLYGETRNGEGWIAKDMVSKVQYNAHFEERTVYFTVNLEIKNVWEKVLKNLQISKLSTVLNSLAKESTIKIWLNKPRTEHTKNNRSLLESSFTNAVTEKRLREVFHEVQNDINQKTGWRPQIRVRQPIWSAEDTLAKTDYISRMEQARQDLEPILRTLSHELL